MKSIDRYFARWLRERLGVGIGIAVAPLDRMYPLMPEEERYVSNAVASRRIEFSAGRSCARRALEELGIAAQAIRMGPRGEPIWPPGVCGSITHSAGICAAVVAGAAEAAGVGIDIVDLREGERVLVSSEAIFSGEAELTRARTTLSGCGTSANALSILFSAKESAIKAMSPSLDRFVEFTEIEVRLEGSNFQAQCGAFETAVHGWWSVYDGHAFTAAVMPGRNN